MTTVMHDALPPSTFLVTFSPDLDFSKYASTSKAQQLTLFIPGHYVTPNYAEHTHWPRATVNKDPHQQDPDRIVAPLDFAQLFQVHDCDSREMDSQADVALRLRIAAEGTRVLKLPRYHREMTEIYSRQNIAYTYAVYARGHTSACIPFDLHNLQFYSHTDLSLGDFLLKYCFDESVRCPMPNCPQRFIDHDRAFLHARARLDLAVHPFKGELAAQFDVSDILTSSICHDCGFQAPFQALRGDSLRCSFGKFLEIMFYNHTLVPFQSSCRHPVTSYTRFFVYGAWIAEITYTAVTAYQLHEPPLAIKQRRRRRGVNGLQFFLINQFMQ